MALCLYTFMPKSNSYIPRLSRLIGKQANKQAQAASEISIRLNPVATGKESSGAWRAPTLWVCFLFRPKTTRQGLRVPDSSGLDYAHSGIWSLSPAWVAHGRLVSCPDLAAEWPPSPKTCDRRLKGAWSYTGPQTSSSPFPLPKAALHANHLILTRRLVNLAWLYRPGYATLSTRHFCIRQNQYGSFSCCPSSMSPDIFKRPAPFPSPWYLVDSPGQDIRDTTVHHETCQFASCSDGNRSLGPSSPLSALYHSLPVYICWSCRFIVSLSSLFLHANFPSCELLTRLCDTLHLSPSFDFDKASPCSILVFHH
ncbi:hypothetical protein EDD37DRAFT_375103 [Exophiala viscosa]|uniref:uncharacterized protein n=1 Tax=Exophiala viscosa TaxID=2486360 RepID=UPI002198919A|nr:hypothetical protein EDD37DRAFT_375103 [Exophiala viscosa]